MLLILVVGQHVRGNKVRHRTGFLELQNIDNHVVGRIAGDGGVILKNPPCTANECLARLGRFGVTLLLAAGGGRENKWLIHYNTAQRGTVFPLHHNAVDTLRNIDNLQNRTDCTHPIQILAFRVVHADILLRGEEDILCLLYGSFDGGGGFFAANVKVQQHAGKNNHPAQRHTGHHI